MIPSVQDLGERFSRLLAGEPTPLAAPGPLPAAPNPGPGPETLSAPFLEGPVRTIDYGAKGWHLEVSVPPGLVVPAAALLDESGFALDAITGVDWMAEGAMELVYDYFHPAVTLRVAVRCRIPRAQPEVPTISGVFPGANWHERETHDFFGIRFAGHPQLLPLLLPEDADYHPLRKDFVA
jgi:NADH-quinone oxidoreductase subunit C